MADSIPKPTVHKSFNLETDLVNLKDKVILVTGANAGIGFYTVQHLLRAGARRVYLGARTEAKANDAIKVLHEKGLGVGGESEVLWHKVDLGDPRDAKKAADEFMQRESRLDILINNAGEMYSGDIGKDGLLNMQIVNNISPYVLTKALLPVLKRTAQSADSDVRIVNVSSHATYNVPKNVQYKTIEDLNEQYDNHSFPNMRRYGNSKLAMILWSQHLQEQLLPSESLPNGITILSIHPGFVNTYTVDVPYFKKFVNALARRFIMVSPDVGAHTSVFAAASKKVLEERERYQANGGVYMEESPVAGTVKKPILVEKHAELRKDLIPTMEKFLQSIDISV